MGMCLLPPMLCSSTWPKGECSRSENVEADEWQNRMIDEYMYVRHWRQLMFRTKEEEWIETVWHVGSMSTPIRKSNVIVVQEQ